MGLMNFWKDSQDRRYRVPFGIDKKDYAQSLLDLVKDQCSMINKSTTVLDFQYSYERISDILSELIWLNEKKKISMYPTPRSNLEKIQNNLSASINDFLDRATAQMPVSGLKRAVAIDKLLQDIENNESFRCLLRQENRIKLEKLKNEAEESRKPPVRRAESGTPDIYEKYGGVDAALLSIDLMDGHEFEHWCANTLKHIGFYDVEVTPPSGDHGVDVLAKKEGIKYAIQCKRYNSDLGNKPVQEVHAGKSLYHCHVGVVITNQYFTAGAKTLADATDTLLWDREWIKNCLEQKSNAPIQPMARATPAHSAIEEHEYEDPMFNDAVNVVIETGQASVSMIQRRLKLGYARAAKLIDTMEERGIVGPFMGSKPRTILITKEQWRIMKR